MQINVKLNWKWPTAAITRNVIIIYITHIIHTPYLLYTLLGFFLVHHL